MKVSNIVVNKQVVTISSSASIEDLVNSLAEHKVGALVVSTDGKIIEGIVSERDIVRSMPGKLEQLTTMHVRDIMTANVHTCTLETTVSELMAMMTDLRIRHIPVVDESKNLVSIVSIGDVVKNHVSDLDNERKALRDYVASGGQ